jgi:hypothetical protein
MQSTRKVKDGLPGRCVIHMQAHKPLGVYLLCTLVLSSLVKCFEDLHRLGIVQTFAWWAQWALGVKNPCADKGLCNLADLYLQESHALLFCRH